MKFQLEIGDRLRSVEVQRQNDSYLVSVDGHARVVEAVRIDDKLWSLIIREGVDGAPRSVEAIVEAPTGNGMVDVHIDGHRIPVHWRNGRVPRTDARTRDQTAAVQRLSSPMPGKIVRVHVKLGDAVKPRQILVVVEAMKMENELRATREGRVVDVCVREGQSVEAGTILAVVE